MAPPRLHPGVSTDNHYGGIGSWDRLHDSIVGNADAYVFTDTPAGGGFDANSAETKLPTTFAAAAAIVAWSGTQYHRSFNYEHELAHATLRLKTSALTTLIRVFDASDEESAFAVLDGQHRVLATQHAWYRGWSVFALPAAFLGLSRGRVLELLRGERRRQRRERRPRPRIRTAVSSPRGQLERLANFISPNAPPLGSQHICVPAGAGVI